MIVVSRNIRYMRIFEGIPREGVNCQTTVIHSLRSSILRCAVHLVIYGQLSLTYTATPNDHFRQSSIRR